MSEHNQKNPIDPAAMIDMCRWQRDHRRYDDLLKYCRKHNNYEDYQPFFYRWTDEEMSNVALSLCHYVDKELVSLVKLVSLVALVTLV